MPRLNYSIDNIHTESWPKNIGKLIVDFSGLEMESHIWLLQMSERPDQISSNARKPFMKRVFSIRSYIETRYYSDQWKTQALQNWEAAERLAEVRNRIAHNPLSFSWNGDKEEGEPDLIGIIDMRGKNKSLDDSPILMSLEDIVSCVNETVSTVTNLSKLRLEWCAERDKHDDRISS